jgi:hypothetical protein
MLKSRLAKESLSILFVFGFTLFVFRGYLSGEVAPPWDFYGDYYTQAYSWWDLGSFFHPTSYMPYLISGYPAHLGLQFSAFYLPVGFIAEIFEYTIINAARLQAITIALGIVGVYVFSRRWGISNGSSIVASFGYLFSAGFFSNASHIDIVRAWAFLPWLLLLLSPVKNFRWWKILIAVFVWFQFFVGAYPGNIASFAYLFLFFSSLLMFFNRDKIRNLLYWYSITVIPGLLMSGLKWIPFLISSSGPQIQNQVKVNLGIFSTIFFPYGGTGQSGDLVLPNDLTQRTFFVIPLILFLTAFARGNKFLTTASVLFLAGSIILGIDFPFFGNWQENLPLLDLSRFRTIDFKPGISLSLSLLAAIGLDQIITRKRMFPKLIDLKYEFLQYLLIAFITISSIVIGRRVGFSDQDISVTYSWLWLSLFVIFLIFGAVKFDLQKVTKGLVITSICFIGISWADSFKDPWQVPRVPTENLYFSGNVDEIISESQSIDLVIRPERNGPALPIPYPGEMIIQFWNSNDLNRNYSTGGYVTIKGNKNFEKYVEYALDADKSKVISFLQKGSAVIFLNNSLPYADDCFVSKVCELKKVTYEYVNYSPGNFKIKIDDLVEPTKVVVNEIGWKGWSAKACDANLNCSVIKVENQDKELLLNAVVPVGTRFLTFEYVTPGLKFAWIIFWVTFLATLINIIYAFNERLFGNKFMRFVS